MPQKSILGSTVAAVLALLAAGCGGTSHRPAVASLSAGDSRAAKSSAPTAMDAAAAAQCMRTHGVPNFPDPITINGTQHFGFYVHNGYAQGQNGTQMNTNSPQYKAAYRYCGDRYLGFSHRPGLTPAAIASARAAALKFAACMRSHGAGNFPDPDNTGAINLPTYNYGESPMFLNAEQACKSLAGKGFVLVTPLR